MLFFVRFFVVLGCRFGTFLEPKIDQNATYEFFLLIFHWFYHYFCILGGSYVGSISVLFSHRFLHRFLVDLGSILEPFWGPLGGPNRSFLASIF